MEGKEEYRNSKDLKLCDLTDDQLFEMMNCVQTDEECSSSDDEDTGFNFVRDEITVEGNEEEICAPQVSDIAPGPSTSLTLIATTIASSSSQDREAVESSLSATETMAIASVKPPKRARSPLPSIESSGPSITPSIGGFTASGTFH